MICEFTPYVFCLLRLSSPAPPALSSSKTKGRGELKRPIHSPRSGLLDLPWRLRKTLNIRPFSIALPFSLFATLQFYAPVVASALPPSIWFCLGCACVMVVGVTKPTFLEIDSRRPCSSSANPLRASLRVQMNRRVIELFHHVVSLSSMISNRLLCCRRETCCVDSLPNRSSLGTRTEKYKKSP